MLKNINFKVCFSGFVRFCSSKFDIKEILKNVTKDKFSIRMVKSSGPGGQHVNKTNSKVELRFKISDATWLSEDLRTKLIAQNNVNKNGEIVVSSDVDRSQHYNLEDAINKIKKKIIKASFVPEGPTEETKDRVNSYKIKENESRIQNKKIHSMKKFERKDVE
ncbi:large ribosomal subunit protein mL62 isoform X1 [Hydra vulgaris]|uniref:large ribosomal subunit protein mL62 isoform X1 n=1 Tax=Hydra vulgaris TaxID=6087 RepID=UPI0032E9C533